MSIMKNINKSQGYGLKKIRFPTRKARSSAKHWYRMNPSASPYLPSTKAKKSAPTSPAATPSSPASTEPVKSTIDGVKYELHEGESIVMPAKHPHAVYGKEQYKMLLVVVF